MSWLFKVSKFELILGSIIHKLNALKDELENKNKLDDEIHKKLLLYERKANEWKQTSRRYSYIILTMYIALYCSVASVFFDSFFIIDELFSLLTTIVSITGTTIFIICLAASQYIRDIHYQKLMLLHLEINLLCALHKVEPEFILTLEDEEKNEYAKMLELLK